MLQELPGRSLLVQPLLCEPGSRGPAGCPTPSCKQPPRGLEAFVLWGPSGPWACARGSRSAFWPALGHRSPCPALGEVRGIGACLRASGHSPVVLG